MSHCRADFTVIPLLPKATFTPSIQPTLGLPRISPPLTSAINTLLAIRYSSILYIWPNHLNTLWSALLANSLSIPAYLRTSAFLTPSIHDTPTKLPKHFISRTLTFLFSALPLPLASAPCNAVGTITHLYRHFLAFIPNPLLLSTLFSYPHALYLFILCTTSLSHPLSAETWDPRGLKQSTSSNGSPFSITSIRAPFPHLEHFITLLLPTMTCIDPQIRCVFVHSEEWGRIRGATGAESRIRGASWMRGPEKRGCQRRGRLEDPGLGVGWPGTGSGMTWTGSGIAGSRSDDTWRTVYSHTNWKSHQNSPSNYYFQNPSSPSRQNGRIKKGFLPAGKKQMYKNEIMN